MEEGPDREARLRAAKAPILGRLPNPAVEVMDEARE